MSPRVPDIERLDKHYSTLAKIVAETSWLPNPQVVKSINKSVFPTVRSMSKRLQTFDDGNGHAIGMYDDNTTPEWALFWSHDLQGTRPSGWTIAHVWPKSNDIEAYTHLANLVMVTESLASLTDKNGPLTSFLQYHAWLIYGWKPKNEMTPKKPDYYDEIVWRYLKAVNDSQSLIRQRFNSLNNQRIKTLHPIMERRGLL